MSKRVGTKKWNYEHHAITLEYFLSDHPDEWFSYADLRHIITLLSTKEIQGGIHILREKKKVVMKVDQSKRRREKLIQYFKHV